MNMKKFTKVFIDCGGHKGESVKLARRILGDDALIVTFEPNSENLTYFESFKSENFLLINKAVWTENTTREFYHNVGGTMCFTSDKILAGSNDNILKTEKIDCIDISSWIEENLSKDQFIYLKLDIEGLEYDILRKIIDNGVYEEYVDKLLIDFHAHRMMIDPTKFSYETWESFGNFVYSALNQNMRLLSQHNEILFNLISINREVYHWDSLNDSENFVGNPAYFLSFDSEKNTFRRKKIDYLREL